MQSHKMASTRGHSAGWICRLLLLLSIAPPGAAIQAQLVSGLEDETIYGTEGNDAASGCRAGRTGPAGGVPVERNQPDWRRQQWRHATFFSKTG